MTSDFQPEEPTTHLWVVEPDQEGWRLDKLLAHHSEGLNLSRTRLQHLIKGGQVSKKGKVCDAPSQKVQTGERYLLIVPALEESHLEPQPMALDILYEDGDLLVINKPAGLVVHPGAGQPNGTLVNGLLAYCGESLSGISGTKRPGIVHRLDKGTSGLLVVAKHDQAHHALCAQFMDRSLSRIYIAFAWGLLTPLHGEIDRPIGRHPVNRQKMAVRAQGGKPAKTFYRTQTAYGRLVSLLECKLETGRTHQIRVHLASLGHPLLGDPVYGNPPRGVHAALKKHLKEILAPERQALHAQKLYLTHPSTGAQLSFEAPIPKDLIALQEALAASV